MATTETVAAAEPRQRRNVGQLLRETRERDGSDLARVAAALRIRAPYLEALEAGQYDRLPGPVYALGFVRAYAIHLGLDGDEAVRRFKIEAEGLEGHRDLSFPVPLVQRSIPGGTMLLVAAILAICGYGLWYYLSSSARPRLERVSAVPAELAPPAAPATSARIAAAPPAAAPSLPPASSAPAPSTTPPPSLAPVSQTDATPPEISAPAVAMAPPPEAAPAPPVPAPDSVPENPTPTAAPIAAAPAPAPVVLKPPTPPVAAAVKAPPAPDGPHVYGLVNGETRVVIRAVTDAWIQVRDPSRTPIFTRQLSAGDIYHVPDRPGLTMRTGKGSGLAIAVDGQQTPPIGGSVRPNVSLDPNRLLAGTAVGE